MDNRMRIMAVEAARLVLRLYREEHPEWVDDRTPLDELVSWLGLQVETFHPDDYKPGTYGFVDADEDENLIWLCRDLSEMLRRFTLAHELGHAILHCHGGSRVQTLANKLAELSSAEPLSQTLPDPSHTDPCHEMDVQENMTWLLDQEQFQEALGIGQDYDPRSQRELAANIFAAELLMPIERLHRLYLIECVPPQSLADIFAVSNAAMLNRLAGLLKEHVSPAGEITEGATQPQAPAVAAPKKQYDEFQQAAIEAPTPSLIVAGPGSGKTSTLIGRTEYIIRTLGVPSQQILALTFSRKAAQEMEERLRQLLAGAYALPKVSTFHAFCADMLRQYGQLVGLRQDFALIDEAEGYFLLRQQANALRLRHYQKLHSPTYYFPDMLKAISRAKDELMAPEAYTDLAQRMKEQAQDDEAIEQAEKALEVAQAYVLYEQELRRRGDTDFGGLLLLAVQLFRQHPEVLQEQQQKYRHILVDEFQDVNRASGVLLRDLAGEEQRVWVVGDANQAIYSFRGASPANISQFTQDFPQAKVLPLSRNYRSRPDLVAVAEAFRCKHLEPNEQPGKNQPARFVHSDVSIALAQAADDTSELAGLVQDIRYKHASGYAYKDIVILCRTRAQAQKISRVLAAEGLPVIERGGTLEQAYIKDLLSIILLLTDQSGMGLLRAARQREHPLSQSDIEAFLLAASKQHVSPRTLLFAGEVPLSVSVEGHRSLRRLAQILQALQRAPDTWSLLAQYLLIETSLVRDLIADEHKQHGTMLADYDRILQLARHYDQQQRAHLRQHKQEGSEEDEYAAELLLEERLKGFLEYLSLLVLLRQDGASRQGSGEDEAESANIIRVMTVHASKGLEFPVVYLPGLVQRRFPLQARSSPVPAPEGMLPPESVGNLAHENGESCLFYVGVTRARDHLVLSYSERYGKQKYKRSPYLDALETGVPAKRITFLRWEPETISLTISAEEADEQAELAPPGPGEEFIHAMKPATLSAGAIEAYQRCPRQYAYSAIYRFGNRADAYQLFWQATHKAVEDLHKRARQEDGSGQSRILAEEEARALYTQHWQALGGHLAPFAEMYEEHGHSIIEAVRRNLSIQEDVNWEARPRYNVEIAGRTVHVTVDRVEASNQTGTPARFVRTRFGKRKDKPVAEMRELFYVLASRQLHPGQSIELHSHNMSTGEMVPVKMTARKEQSLYEDVERSIQGLESNAYPAQPAEPFRCPGCPFFLICPA
ncbi:MAG TPA: ATP-dependent helicase [Ktedonosporobacter sp.]|nr:ATP-dependent helicase [Ktedonosporobacter sp.]